MSETPAGIGSISWVDLTVPDATTVRDFYRDVVGWSSTDVSMGEYNDYGVNEPGSGKTVAGICHARGPNAGHPRPGRRRGGSHPAGPGVRTPGALP